MMSVHDALEAWQAGEITTARAMELSGASDVLELHGLAQACDIQVRTEMTADEADVVDRVTQAIRRVAPEFRPDGPAGMKAA